jgi:hypothetical protein
MSTCRVQEQLISVIAKDTTRCARKDCTRRVHLLGTVLQTLIQLRVASKLVTQRLDSHMETTIGGIINDGIPICQSLPQVALEKPPSFLASQYRAVDSCIYRDMSDAKSRLVGLEKVDKRCRDFQQGRHGD